MKKKQIIWLQLGLLGLIVGLLGVTQFRTQANILKALQAESPVNQAAAVADLLEANAALAQEVRTLEDQLTKYNSGDDRSGLEALVTDLNRLKVVNGLIEVWGPGVEVLVGTEIQPEEAHDIINELRNSGAEAIAIDNQRLVASSTVTRVGRGLAVDSIPVDAPYVFRAIGDVQTMEVALERKGGVIPLLRYSYPNSSIVVTHASRIVLPVRQGRYEYRFARPVDN